MREDAAWVQIPPPALRDYIRSLYEVSMLYMYGYTAKRDMKIKGI